jgi:hypothetical protein
MKNGIIKTIKGPIVPLAAGNIIYQITLESGMIITNPASFGLESNINTPSSIVVGENGKVLAK